MTLHLEPAQCLTKYLSRALDCPAVLLFYYDSKQHNTGGCDPGDVYRSSGEHDQVLPLLWLPHHTWLR